MITSSQSRYSNHSYTDCERESNSLYLIDGTETAKKYAYEHQPLCLAPYVSTYTQFFATLCGFSLENDLDTLADLIGDPDGFPWVGEILDGECFKSALFTDDHRITQNGKLMLEILGEEGVPISINQCLLGFYDANGELVLEPDCWLESISFPGCWELGTGDFVCCDEASRRFTNLMEAAKARGATVHLNVANRPFFGILAEDSGKAFWEAVFQRYPNLKLELVWAHQGDQLVYNPSDVDSLPPDFLDLLVNYSDHFTIGSHIATGTDYTPLPGTYGSNLSGYQAYWDTVFQQVYRYPQGTAEERWYAVQNIAHKNVEDLLGVTPIPGYDFPEPEERAALELGDQRELPARIRVTGPNPFLSHEGTSITYSLPCDAEVTLGIYTPSGQRVKTLVSREHERGEYQITWDGTDESGHPLPAGVYFCKLTSRGYSSVRRMVLLR